MKKLLFLMMGVFSFLLVSVGGVQASYTEVFTDDFNRADGTDIGNSWQDLGQNWILSSGQVESTKLTTSNKPLIRPEIFRDGKVEFVRSPGTGVYAPFAIARYTGDNYYVGWILNQSQITITKTLNGVLYNMDNPGIKISIKNALGLLSGSLKGEFIVQSLSEETTYLEFSVYNMSGDKLATITGTDSTPVLQTSGQWGVNSYGISSFDDISLYNGLEDTLVTPSLGEDFSFTGNKESMRIGDFVTYTIKATGDMTIILSTDKAGRFSPNPGIAISGSNNLIISLNANNSYMVTFTYTADQSGLHTITALGIGENQITRENQVFVYPYSSAIGYIGDSITQGVGGSPNAVQVATTTLGTGFTAVNRGVSGSTTKSWVNSLLVGAISAFQSNGVEIVSIMLGTNDSKVAENISVEEYKVNLETIITQLKAAGIKKIILNEPPYILPQGQRNATSLDKMIGYIGVIDELVDGEQVIRGDKQAYEYFEANQNELPDTIHPNTLGHQHLGEFWAGVITGMFDSQINPNKQRLSGINEHTLTTTSSLTLVIEKYFGEFLDVVKIDGSQISTGYVASTGSTHITLSPEYLNTLGVGSHSIEVNFYGGVKVSDTFTIKNKPSIPSGGGGGGGGGGGSASKDNCPHGDTSPSYYDGICGTPTSEPVKNEEEKKETSSTSSSATGTKREEDGIENVIPLNDEVISAYDWAYKYDITTLAPLEQANPQGTVIRGHLAKMVVNYVINVLGRTLPEKVPATCYRKDGANARESQEIKDYATKACQLGLMGIDMDYFQPYAVVTRAQFGTILSRLLWQTTYAGGKPYYVKHLEALKEHGILTQIENPEERVELRQWVWLMLMRSAR